MRLRGLSENLFKIFAARKLENKKAGLPDFYWHNIPKREKNVPNSHKINQMAAQYNK
jgi:hypothetical protein